MLPLSTTGGSPEMTDERMWGEIGCLNAPKVLANLHRIEMPKVRETKGVMCSSLPNEQKEKEKCHISKHNRFDLTNEQHRQIAIKYANAYV